MEKCGTDLRDLTLHGRKFEGGGGGKGKGGGVLARGEHHNDIGTRVNSGQVKTRMTVGFSRNDSIEGGYGATNAAIMGNGLAVNHLVTFHLAFQILRYALLLIVERICVLFVCLSIRLYMIFRYIDT